MRREGVGVPQGLETGGLECQEKRGEGREQQHTPGDPPPDSGGFQDSRKKILPQRRGERRGWSHDDGEEARGLSLSHISDGI